MYEAALTRWAGLFCAARIRSGTGWEFERAGSAGPAARTPRDWICPEGATGFRRSPGTGVASLASTRRWPTVPEPPPTPSGRRPHPLRSGLRRTRRPRLARDSPAGHHRRRVRRARKPQRRLERARPQRRRHARALDRRRRLRHCPPAQSRSLARDRLARPRRAARGAVAIGHAITGSGDDGLTPLHVPLALLAFGQTIWLRLSIRAVSLRKATR